MSFTIGVPKERIAGERLVAAVPDVISRLVKSGATVHVEREAGAGAFISDAEFSDAGAKPVSKEEAFGADIVLKVQLPLTRKSLF